MSLTVSDVVRHPSLFRLANPHWPRPEPDPDERCGSCGHQRWRECGCSCCPYSDEQEG